MHTYKRLSNQSLSLSLSIHISLYLSLSLSFNPFPSREKRLSRARSQRNDVCHRGSHGRHERGSDSSCVRSSKEQYLLSPHEIGYMSSRLCNIMIVVATSSLAARSVSTSSLNGINFFVLRLFAAIRRSRTWIHSAYVSSASSALQSRCVLAAATSQIVPSSISARSRDAHASSRSSPCDPAERRER